MRNNNNSLTAKKFVECFSNSCFWEAIECTCWFIEDKDLWVSKKNPSDNKTLSFSSGETNSLLSYESIESSRKPIYKVAFCMRKCCQKSLITWCIYHTTDHIFPDSSIKYRRFLWEISDMWEITCEFNIGKILIVYKNITTFWLQETYNHFNDSTFSSSALPNKCNLFSTRKSCRKMRYNLFWSIWVSICNIGKFNRSIFWTKILSCMKTFEIFKTVKKIP